MIKVLITYVPAGAGHRKAAEAVFGHIKTQPGVEASIVDVLQETDPIFCFLYTKGYDILVNYGTRLWGAAFYLTSARGLRRPLRALARVAHRILTNNYLNFLRAQNPDYIVSTHFLTSECAALLKRAGMIKSFLITVITDFDVHPFWICRGTDMYMAASEATKTRLLTMGIEEKRIKVSGIPVHSSFLRQYDRAAARAKLGLDARSFTVLLMTGSFGSGPLAAITASLEGEAQVIVVCGRNAGLCGRLRRKKYQGVAVVGFADNIAELMAASDMIVTKPGGLTIAELLVMELVPVFISPIPGQETQNISVLGRYGISQAATGVAGVRDIVRDYKLHPGKLNLLRDRIRELKRLYAAKAISDVICASGSGDSG